MPTNNSWNNQIASAYNQIILNAGTNGVAISTDASAATVNVSTGAAVKTTTLGSTNSTSATTVQSGTGALNVTSTNGALTVNSGTGALGISTDASATTLSIGTGGAVKTVTVGSTNTTSVTTIACGTGGANFGTSANAHATVVGSTTAASTTTIQAPSAGVILTGVQGVAVANKNYVTINTSTGAIGSDAGPTAGSLVRLSTVTAAAAASVIFNSTFVTSTYNNYLLMFTQVLPGTNGVTMNMDWSTNNGSSYLATSFQTGGINNGWNSALISNFNAITTCQISATTGMSNTLYTGGQIILTSMTSGTGKPAYTGQAMYTENTYASIYGVNSTAALVINNIRISMSSGTISGIFILYGIAS